MVASVQEISRHKCLIYDGHPSEQLPVIVPLLMDGLAEERRCLYLGSPEMIGMVKEALAAKGVDVPAEERRTALVFSSDRSHLDGGFNPKGMVTMLIALVDEAVADGFTGLCATGDMCWELGAEENFEKLREYEALLETVFRTKPLKGVCQYNRSTVPERAIQDALQSHRSLYVGSTLNRDNLFYMPPELLLADADAAARDQRGRWMCEQITRILKAEEKRDAALHALEKSEAEQRRLAVELAEANRDLERRVRERTLELEAANKELESFSYSVSHDLRAPLRSILGFSQLAIEDIGENLSAEGRESLDRVSAAARRMSELIEGMLKLAHLAKRGVERRPIDLTALAEAVFQELRREDPERKVELAVAKDLRAMGDPTLLRNVLDNLIGNAWKFTSKRPSARIEVGRAGEENGGPIFFVKDDGAGFEMEYAKKLFGPFQRLHSEAEFPGNGIGLATVHRIITRHGGRIWAESAPGKGATFYFTLPPG